MKRIVIAVALVLGVAGTASAAHHGADLYKSKCAACHGANGEGAKMAPTPIAGMAAADVKKVILEGKGKMKPVKGVEAADADEIGKVVAGQKK